jgi:hypothetical protein
MKSKDQFLRAYDAGKEAYKSDAEKKAVLGPVGFLGARATLNA